ncbi:MAG: hypothetical protein AAF363_13290 [Bacteroidota bacterium]
MEITDKTRTISFLNNSDEDLLDEEVELAVNSSIEENFVRYCSVLSAQLAMQNIDLKKHPVERIIYFIE